MPADLDSISHPIPLFEYPQVQVPLASDVRAPRKLYTFCAKFSAPLPDSSMVSGTSRTRHPPDRFSLSGNTNHPIAKYMSY